MIRLIIISFLSIFLINCNNVESNTLSKSESIYVPDDAFDEEIEFEPPRTHEPQHPTSYVLDKRSKIIKKGHVKFEVNKLDASKFILDSLLHQFGGYYESERFISYSTQISYQLNMRIPHTTFDSLLSELGKGLGKLHSKHITADDVTDEYVDLDIRLNNKLAYLRQYQEILKRATSIKEILDVQDKIRIIEEEIESNEGRLKYLDDQVKYSTLTIEISELITKEVSNQPNFGRRIANSFNSGVQGLVNFVLLIIGLWPLCILVGLLIFGRKSITNRILKSK